MVDVRSAKCEEPGCNVRPLFNYKGVTPGVRCAAHKLKDMVDVCSANLKAIRNHQEIRSRAVPALVAAAQRPVDTAIETAAKYYSKDPPKKRPVWLAWLEGCIHACIRADTGKLFHFFASAALTSC